MESLVRYFAVALAKRGITVNAISPGFTEDSVLNSLPEAAQDMVRQWHGEGGWTPMGRLGTPPTSARVALLSRAVGVTLGDHHADGGASLMSVGAPCDPQG